MPKFSLIIDLGNDAMSTEYDVAAALERAAFTLKQSRFADGGWQIHDRNGNKVGHYEVVE